MRRDVGAPQLPVAVPSQGSTLRRTLGQLPPGDDAILWTPGQMADEWVRFVKTRAVDGFSTPYQIPGTIDDVVDKLDLKL